MKQVTTEELKKSCIEYTKKLIREGYNLNEMKDEELDEAFGDMFKSKKTIATNAIQAGTANPKQLQDAVMSCFEIPSNVKSSLVREILTRMNPENIVKLLQDGLANNFEGTLHANVNNKTRTFKLDYFKKAKLGAFGSSQHAAIS